MASAFFSIASALLGPALSVPFAFGEVGALTASMLLFVVASMAAYGLRLITLCLCSEKCLASAALDNVEPRDRELSFLAFCAYGHRGRVITSLVLSMELWFALVVNFVSIGVNGTLLTHGMVPQGIFIGISAIALFPVLDAPAWLLGLGGVCSLIGTGLCALVLFDAALEPWVFATAESSKPPPEFHPVPTAASNFLSLMSAIGIFVYTYGNTVCLPPIRSEMKCTKAFPATSAVALFASVLFYGALGMSSIAFGDSIGQCYLANITRPSARAAACSSIILSMTCSMPLMTNPILLSLLPAVRVRTPLGIFAFKVVFTAISASAAIFLQDSLAILSSLTGTSLTMLTVILLPACIYARLVPDISVAEKILLVFIMSFGIVFVILGTYAAAVEIVG